MGSISAEDLKSNWNKFKKFATKKSPSLRIIYEANPRFSNGVIFMNFGDSFIKDQFVIHQDTMFDLAEEFFAPGIKIFADTDRDATSELENAPKVDIENKLNEIDSSEDIIEVKNESNPKKTDLYPIEKILIEKLKAKDITNKL